MKIWKFSPAGGVGGWAKRLRLYPPWWVKKNPTQLIMSKPTQPTWIKLSQVKLMDWTICFFIITIIIKLSKKMSHLPPELINKKYMN